MLGSIRRANKALSIRRAPHPRRAAEPHSMHGRQFVSHGRVRLARRSAGYRSPARCSCLGARGLGRTACVPLCARHGRQRKCSAHNVQCSARVSAGGRVLAAGRSACRLAGAMRGRVRRAYLGTLDTPGCTARAARRRTYSAGGLVHSARCA